ncbi:MAG TPA: rhamnogalacturonan acetylesterase [Humisphaera sp.]|jgi:lysophospholipase L1-like esterase|nr:rhamnogalacturonan acetylesterase [Humisphaera sp.]
MRALLLGGVFVLLLAASMSFAQAPAGNFKFVFNDAPAAPGRMLVEADRIYSDQIGYGFEPGRAPTGPVSGRPFYFSVKLPEGNYKVTVTFGNALAESDNTVFAELRRLMIERVQTAPSKFETRSFIVNIRQPKIAGGGEVRLVQREQTSEKWAWDDRLTLEFNGAHPAVSQIDIEPANVPTLFLIGDSTVCDQPSEPYNSWGQMITRFFKPTIAVANHAESGESVAGALAKGRLDKIWSQMKSGDTLFLQFGHNDMKSTAPDALERYTNDLRKVVDQTRAHGGEPILFTPVSRRSFNNEGKITNSFNGYPDAVKLVAKEKNVPLVDLQATGAAFYEAMGPDASHRAFANARENTHHSDYGSYEIAKAIVQRLKQMKLPISQQIVDDFASFDPSHPDRFEDFKIPPSGKVTNQTPAGN